MKLTLTPRLRAVAAYVAQGAYLADIGTDHGYLPAFLVQNGVCPGAVAADVRPGPLAVAVKTAQAAGVDDRIEFVLTDGLDGIDPQKADTVVLAGMGGETMADILSRAPWTLDRRTHLILQPQTKLDVLSAWLDAAGYAYDDACLVRDSGRLYTVFSARRGERRGPFSGAQLYVDPLFLEKRDPLLPAYLDALIRTAAHAVQGLERAAQPDEQELARQRLLLEGLRTMKKEMETWQQ